MREVCLQKGGSAEASEGTQPWVWFAGELTDTGLRLAWVTSENETHLASLRVVSSAGV